MEWCDKYGEHEKPERKMIADFVKSRLWNELCDFIENSYKAKPKIEYSGCSMQKGWNLKYKKGGRSLCTLYPEEGSFLCLVSIGRKEADRAEFILPSCSDIIRQLYDEAKPFNGSRWLMIPITDVKLLEDVKKLIAVRAQSK